MRRAAAALSLLALTVACSPSGPGAAGSPTASSTPDATNAGPDRSIADRDRQRYAEIDWDSETVRDAKTTGYECSRRIARHRSLGR